MKTIFHRLFGRKKIQLPPSVPPYEQEVLIPPERGFWPPNKYPRNKTTHDELEMRKILALLRDENTSILISYRPIPTSSVYVTETITITFPGGSIKMRAETSTMYPMFLGVDGASFSNKYVANDAYDILRKHPKVSHL